MLQDRQARRNSSTRFVGRRLQVESEGAEISEMPGAKCVARFIRALAELTIRCISCVVTYTFCVVYGTESDHAGVADLNCSGSVVINRVTQAASVVLLLCLTG